MSDVKVIKLLSGEEIVATTADKDSTYEITDAVTIVYQQTEEGGTVAGFAPYMPYSSGKIILNKSSITSYSEVDAKLLAEYNRIFSKIEIVPASAIIK